MGLLTFFSKSSPSLLRLHAGSFTVDREGTVLVRTLPSSFPQEVIEDISEQVLAAFRESAEAHLPLSEVIINYPSLRITARELRGGALVFLAPKNTPGVPQK
jgi:hypothetical protein